MNPVLFYPGIGIPHPTGHPPDPAVNDIVIQRRMRCSEGSAEHAIDVLMGEPMDAFVYDFRNFYFRGSVLILSFWIKLSVFPFYLLRGNICCLKVDSQIINDNDYQ